MKYLEQIEAYWEQRMSIEERDAFEQELAENAQLREEMKAYEASLRLLEISSTGQPEGKHARYTWLSIAAAILLILGLCLFTYANLLYTPARLADNSYQAPLLTDLQRGNGMDIEASRAFQLFAAENYPAAIQQLIGKDSLSDSQAYLLAHAYYKSNNWTAAEAHFNRLLENNNFPNGARWYLALTQLQAGKTAQARRQLDTISRDQHSPNKERAALLLKKLDSNWQKLVF